ncbi:hypothetical protein ACFE04_016398 [Oxalis oulophora]
MNDFALERYSCSMSLSSESSCLSTTRETDFVVTELEMDAARQLMQLSGEDHHSFDDKKRKRRSSQEEKEITSVMVEDILFEKHNYYENDKNVNIINNGRRKIRYRSILNIYETTKPIMTGACSCT